MATNAGYLPDKIVAGETIWISASNTTQDGVAADITFDDYTPAGGYTLAYQFAAATPITVSAAANGANTGWSLEVTAAQTLLWAPGKIAFSGYVTKPSTGRVFAVDLGSIIVEASPLRVSSWQAALTACDAAIADYAANPYGSFNVGDLQITYRSLSQLTELREFLASRVAEDNANRPKRIIRTRFTL